MEMISRSLLAEKNPGSRVVWILNYKDTLNDARVLKQARALADHGCQVHVWCGKRSMSPKYEKRFGIHFHRFDWKSPRHITVESLGVVEFMPETLSCSNLTFDKLVKIAPVYHDSIKSIEEEFDEKTAARLLPSWAKRGKSRNRKARQFKRSRFRLKTALNSIYNISSFPKVICSIVKLQMTEPRLRQIVKRTYQAVSVLFAVNLSKQDFSGVPAPNVVHGHDIHCLPAAVYVGKRFDATVIYDAHEYEPERVSWKNPYGAKIPSLIEEECLPHVDHMITVSDEIAELYDARFKGGYPTIIYNAPSFPEKRPEVFPDPLMERDELRGEKVVVYTGAIGGPKRGLDKVVEALAYMPERHLAVLGPRNAGADKWLMDVVRRVGVERRVHLYQPVDASEVVDAISGCDVAVHPLQDDGANHRFAMPNKLFEAVFAEVPICVSDLPSMGSFVQRFNVGAVMDQTDARSIAETIEKVSADRGRYLASPEVRSSICSEFSWDAQAQKLTNLYDCVAKS